MNYIYFIFYICTNSFWVVCEYTVDHLFRYERGEVKDILERQGVIEAIQTNIFQKKICQKEPKLAEIQHSKLWRTDNSTMRKMTMEGEKLVFSIKVSLKMHIY